MIIKNGEVVTDGEESEKDELTEATIEENEYELEDGSKLTLVTRRLLSAQEVVTDGEDQRDIKHHLRCLVNGMPCSFVNDNGSCMNVVIEGNKACTVEKGSRFYPNCN
ncbi:hypothetical protein E5676_scaffold880G00250 [Cucumis melo var. makuwa]|uniref:Uncharacterized protein n=1 Tax=Cucumis melo var. makuwa TaxID=1194695 RepID=A0A5A7UIN5_CUCMM|nr:hypothetical protein E6C27_scaffold27G00140 [Cucumis melo var. makuwa]TYK29210.1 hypothetical protein E5676_scaffold880G00250 [Cucumis melo var. makuwa]